MLALTATLQACAGTAPTALVRGVVWQPDAATLAPSGDWDRLGARELIVQWTWIDGRPLLATGAEAGERIDAAAVAQAPWAGRVIVGLAGMRSEAAARGGVRELAEVSRALAAQPPPWRVSGWYFPVELDPTWADVAAFRAALDRLPRPLWISVYDSANLGPAALVAQIRRATPDDVGLLFQDGVGVYARTPEVARGYLDALRAAFGRKRVRAIAEAFRATPDGFRSATACELASQLRAYASFPIYLFDGPHYVSPRLVAGLLDTFGEGAAPSSDKHCG